MGWYRGSLTESDEVEDVRALRWGGLGEEDMLGGLDMMGECN